MSIFNELIGDDPKGELNVSNEIEKLIEMIGDDPKGELNVSNVIDYIEKLENGNYFCKCIGCNETFIGYKRRVYCKLCHGISKTGEGRE